MMTNAETNLNRLRKIFRRVSRDRYITPYEFSLFAYDMATRIYSNRGTASRELNKYFFDELYLGIYKGSAPFKAGTHQAFVFNEFIKKLQRKKPIQDARIEMQILKLTIEGIKK